MRVVYVNTTDSGGGAARAALRLLHGVRAAGVDCRMIVQRKFGDDIAVMGPEGRLGNELSAVRTLLDCTPLGLYPKRNCYIFSPAFLPDSLHWKVNKIKPDILHLHWIGEGALRLENLTRFNCPIVWTLHDSWAFTGGCHIPFDCTKYREKCGCCPTLGSNNQYDLSRWVWRRKERIFHKLNLTIVTPSHWLAKCAKSSSLLHRFPIMVIPNGLDLSRYRPLDKSVARQLLGLPQDKKLILFGAINGTSDKNKGFHLLQSAFQVFLSADTRKRVELLVFGASEPINAPDLGLKTHYLGRMFDDISIALLYSAADVFIAPSIQENLSTTVMESMACGTPCVAFDIGGMPDLIEHEFNGYLSKPFEPEDLAHGMAWVLDDERLQVLSRNCRDKVTDYSLEHVVSLYTDLYNTLITN